MEHPPEQVREPKANHEDKPQPPYVQAAMGEEVSTMQTQWSDAFCTHAGTL